MAYWKSFALALSMVVGNQGVAFAAPAAEDYQRVAGKAYANYILPSFEGLEGVARQVEARIGDFCAKPSQAEHESVRKDFGRLIYRWGSVEFLRFGPMQSNNRFERLLFWPDRKGTALKKVRRAIVNQDPVRLDAEKLAKGSVAYQGLNALEYVLFGSGFEDLWVKADGIGGYRCQLAKAIAGNIVATSADLVQAWSMEGFGKIFTQPGKDNPLYRESKEVVAELVKALGTNGQYFTDVKLLPVVGKSAKKARPKKAMFRRSGASIISMTSSLDHAKRLIKEADFASLLDEEAWWIFNSTDFELKNAHKALDAIEKIGMSKAVRDEDGRKQFQYLETTVRGFGDLMIADYAAASGLVIGFNSLDGD